jgi:hypothetical protein
MTTTEICPVVAGLLYTPEETAAYLKIKVDTLQIWRTTGRYPELRPKYVGGAVRYRGENILAFGSDGRGKAAPYVPKNPRPKPAPRRKRITGRKRVAA